MDTLSFLFVLIIFIYIPLVVWAVIALTRKGESLVQGELDKSEKEVVKESKEKSNSIIHRAIGQANKILVAAELKGVKLVAAEKIASDKLATEYSEHLRLLSENMEKQFEKIARDGESSYENFAQKIELLIKQSLERNEKTFEEKTNLFIENAQGELGRFTSDVHNRVRTQIDQELAAARAEIAEYKKHRLKALDENIIEILEKTLQVALGKKMSLADQSELIYKALEEAKKEHAFSQE